MRRGCDYARQCGDDQGLFHDLSPNRMMSIEPAAGIGGVAGRRRRARGARHPRRESICSVRIAPGSEENCFLQYCILNRARMSASADSRSYQDFAAAQQAGMVIRTTEQALRDRDTRSVPGVDGLGAIIDTSAIEVCVEHG